MKRFLAMLISAAVLLALPGCGGGGVSLLEGVAPAPAGEAADAAPLAADFTMKLFNAAYEGGDALISPVSVLAALAMAEAGARGNTLAQMEETFGVDTLKREGEPLRRLYRQGLLDGRRVLAWLGDAS